MIKIGICDDELIFAEEIYGHICEIVKQRTVDASVHKFCDPKELIAEHEKSPFDVLFLDIDMPAVSGFDVSAIIRETAEPSYIIFVSAKHELVYNSFEYNPFYFICKSSDDDLERQLAHVMGRLLSHFQQHRKIRIYDTANGVTVVRLSDIIYIMSDGHYLMYYVKGRVDPYMERSKLNEKEKEINCSDFVRTHLRYLVNMRHISKFNGMINTVKVSNGDEVPLSRKLKDKATQLFMIYKRR